MNGDNVIEMGTQALMDIEAWDIDCALSVRITAARGVEVVVRAAQNGFLPHNISSATAIGAHSLVLTEQISDQIMAAGIGVETLVIGKDTRCQIETHPIEYSAPLVNRHVKAWVDAVVEVERSDELIDA